MKKILIFLILTSFFLLYADPPDWQQIQGTQFSMVLMAQVNFSGDNFANENGNMVAAFGPGGETDCRAVGSWQTPNPPLQHFWYFTIVSNEDFENITFKIYDGNSDTVFNCATNITFNNDDTVGSPTDPFQISTEIGTLSGTITLVPEGNVIAVTISAGGYSTNPDVDGFYEMQMAPGTYTVNASLTGYTDISANNVQIQIGQTTIQNFTLMELADFSLALPPQLEAPAGNSFIIPITLSNVDGASLEGFDITLSFDSSILTANTATLDGGILEGMNYGLIINTATDGEISLVIYANGDLINSNGTIAFIDFTVNPAAETGESCLISFSVANVNEIPVTNYGCEFTVSDVLFNISGNIQYYSNEAPIEDVVLALSGDAALSTESNQFGNYYFNEVFTGNYTSTPAKTDDLGGLSGTDASRVARFSAGLYELDGYQMIAADVTMNGEISALDASRIARYSAGLIDDMNSGIDWVFSPEPITNWDDWPPIEYSSIRTYSPLQSNMENEDFIGIRLGDVTGNWDRSALQSTGNLNKPVLRSTEIVTEILTDPIASLPEITALPASIINIPLTVTDLTELEGLDMTISFDENIIEITDVTLEGGILENENYAILFNTEIVGQCTTVLYANDGLFSGSGVVLNLITNVIGDDGDASALSFLQFEVNEISYIANVINGEITIEQTSAGEEEVNITPKLLGNYPNPFNPNTKIFFIANGAKDTKIVIYNLKGQKVKQLVNDQLPTGKHTIVWNGTDENNQPVSSGIYFYKLKAGQSSSTKKMLLLK